MNRFLKNIALLALPLGLYLLIILVVDPYNYLNLSHLVDDGIKQEISMNVEPHLYKLIDFENHPRRNITLGDSRTNSLYECMDGERWANLAFGGGTIKEMVQAFWWAVEQHEIDTVVIGINLNLYNKYNKRFWVEETIETKKNFFSYAFNKFTFRSAFLVIKSALTRKEVSINETTLSQEDFWQQQLDETPQKFFGQYAYPDNYYEELKGISEYCGEQGIRLIFWIPPTHVEFQARISSYHLEEANDRFMSDLISLGDLYDYNFPNELTSNKENFRDPLHFTQEIAVQVRDEILGRRSFVARHHGSISAIY